MTIEELRAICDMTVELTKVRQLGCAHLYVENFAPELFAKLMAEWKAAHAVTEPVSG